VSELPAAVLWALYVWAALAGACVGSFLNVVVARVPAGESIVRPGSRCPRCKAPIAWYDNVPVVAWLLLRGRCRRCQAPISIRYPLVELAGAAIAVLVVWRNGPSPAALLEFAFAAMLLALALIDLDAWLLPHALTWPLIALGLVTAALGAGPSSSLASSLWGAGVGFAAFAAISVGGEKLLKKEALGFGDVWLLTGLGAFLGLPALLPVVLLASTQGAIVGIVLIALGKGQPGPDATPPAPPHPEVGPTPPEPSLTDPLRSEVEETEVGTADEDWIPPKHAVPFGPFLVAGALEWLWLGDLLARAIPGLDLFR
jgi:leader peptidase (prepilin peptidase)/N-methyltransferase